MRLNPGGQVEQQLHAGLAPCYAVAGEEPLLIQETLDAIRAAARRQGFAERETLDAERDFDWNRLLETCATGSLFAEHRIVELRLGAAAGEAGNKTLVGLVDALPSDVLLIVVAGRLDARARKSGWYAAIERAGAACYCWPVTADEFPRWMAQRLLTAGLHAGPEALELLTQRTEGNLLAAAQEIDKLGLLHPDGRLDAAAVAAGVVDAARYGVFDWIDKLMAGDAAGAVRGLARLREEGEALPALGAALALDLRKLAACAASPGTDLVHHGVFRMRQAAFGRALARSRPRQVQGWLRRLAAVDTLVKSGGEAAAWAEMLALALAIAGVRQPLARSALGRAALA